MGLDMYLTAKKTMPRAAAIVLHKVAPDEFTTWDNPWLKTESQEVEAVATAAYWRKANAVHGWFVREVQGGTDDCGTYPVTAQQLEELRDACKAVLAGEDGEEHDLIPMRGFLLRSNQQRALVHRLPGTHRRTTRPSPEGLRRVGISVPLFMVKGPDHENQD